LEKTPTTAKADARDISEKQMQEFSPASYEDTNLFSKRKLKYQL